MPAALIVFLLVLFGVALSIFLLGVGVLLRRRCGIRPCGSEGPVKKACAGCPASRLPTAGSAGSSMEV